MSPRQGEAYGQPARHRSFCCALSAGLGPQRCGMGARPVRRAADRKKLMMTELMAPPRGAARYELDSALGRLTPAERAARGKAARAEVPRDSHAMFDPPADRPDPIGLL